MGTSIPYSQVSAQGVATAFQEARISLSVTPHVTNDGAVSMEVSITRDEPDFNQTSARGDPTISALDPIAAHRSDRIDIVGTDLYDLSELGGDPLDLFGSSLPVVSFGGRRSFFVFPTIEGLRVVVPFHAETGDVIVKLGGVASNAVPFTVR